MTTGIEGLKDFAKQVLCCCLNTVKGAKG